MLVLPIGDLNPTRRWPLVTFGLILINVAVFVYAVSQGGRGFNLLTAAWGAIPVELLTGRDLPPRIPLPVHVTLLTSMFLHGGVGHLLGNMLYLWIFGDNVEDALGHLRYLLFYVMCGLIASFSHLAFNLGSSVPAVGASGAISGILGAYLLLYPRGQVRVFIWLLIIIRVVHVPAWIMLTLWFVLQASQALGSEQGDVAVWAHIGGFVAGLVLVRLFLPPQRTASDW